MKPIYEKLVSCPDEGFLVKELRGEECNCAWHCHAEVELILVLRSQGYRIVGDTIQSLRCGDLVLLGPNLPHVYQHTDRRTARPAEAHCLLLQFESRVWSGLLDLPAMAAVRRLLERSAQGLLVADPTGKQVATMLRQMLAERGLRRIATFLTLLDTLAQSRRCQAIASAGFTQLVPSQEQERIGRICQYIDAHYEDELRVSDVAHLVHMSEGAFSRFFHAHMGKTFPAFVNELRIGRACRLLVETEQSMTEIALACGYQNLSNFNRQFLRRKQVAPSKFRRQMRVHG